MTAPTREQYEQKGREAALAGEARPVAHAGSWQRESFLKGFDAVAKNEPPLLKYVPAINAHLNKLDTSRWDQGALAHTRNLTDQLSKEQAESRAHRIYVKILGMMGRYGGLNQSKQEAACASI